jgi:hypothetical protein
MSFFPNDSAIKVAPGSELERAVSAAKSVSEKQQILFQAAQDQHLIERDGFDSEGRNHFAFHPVEPGTLAAAKGYATTVTIDGVKHVLEAGTEQELLAKETALYRAALQLAATTQAEIEAEAARVADLERPRNERGQFITHDPAITALAPTVAAALEAQGIDVAALQEFTAAKQGERLQTSWAEATETFRTNHPDWIGGEANQALFARLLNEGNLIDAADKSAALEAVYNYAVENNLLVENPELTARDAIGKAQTYDELKAAIGYRGADGSSGLWGR